MVMRLFVIASMLAADGRAGPKLEALVKTTVGVAADATYAGATDIRIARLPSPPSRIARLPRLEALLPGHP